MVMDSSLLNTDTLAQVGIKLLPEEKLEVAVELEGGVTEHLEQVIRSCIGSFVQQHNNNQGRLFNDWPAEYILDGWYIRLLKGGEITAHTHQGWLSGVLYLRVPVEKKNNAGNIEFTLQGYDLPVVRNDFPRQVVTTQPGRLVLFPSSLPHRVFPFSEKQERLSIAFDIVPA